MAGARPPSRREGFLGALLGTVADAPIYVYGRDLRAVEYFWNGDSTPWGFVASDFIGRRAGELMDPEEVARFQRALQQVFDTGDPMRFEDLYHLPVGPRWFEVRLSPIRAADGAIEYVLSASYDITEHRRAAEVLRESQRRFESLAESVPIGIVWRDADGTLVYRNRLAEQISGLPNEALERGGWLQAVHPDDRAAIARMRDEMLASPQVREYELRFLRRDGSYAWVFANTAPVFDRDGRPTGAVTGFIDISARKAVEQALGESERRLRTIAESAPVGIVRLDREGRIVFANRVVEQVTGRSSADLVANGWLGSVHPDDLERLRDAEQRQLESPSRAEDELRMVRPDGQVSWLLARTIPELDESGHCIGYLASLLDITERKATEQALRESEHRFHTLAEAMPVGVWRTNRDLTLVYANRRNWELLDADAEDPRNRDLRALLARLAAEGRIEFRESERLREESERAVRDSSANPSGFCLRLADGGERHLRTLALPERDSEGNFVGHVGVTVDVTELELAQQELARHRDHLGELVAERTIELERSHEALRRGERLAAVGTFAAGIAHQVNNPVGAILLAAQFALEAPDDRERVETALRNITADARHCARVVRGVLEFARGPGQESEPCSLNQIALDCVRKLTPDATERGAALRVDLDPELPTVAGSGPAFEQVLSNLVYNSIEAGATAISIETRRVDGAVEVAVRDDGCGIDDENLDRIFDPLFTTRAGRGGTGLGLALARGVVEACGGAIDVKSRESEGTTVTVRLRRA